MPTQSTTSPSESNPSSSLLDDSKETEFELNANESTYKPRASFPNRLEKQSAQMEILEVFKQIKFNIPLLDAIQQVPSYT